MTPLFSRTKMVSLITYLLCDQKWYESCGQWGHPYVLARMEQDNRRIYRTTRVAISFKSKGELFTSRLVHLIILDLG